MAALSNLSSRIRELSDSLTAKIESFEATLREKAPVVAFYQPSTFCEAERFTRTPGGGKPEDLLYADMDGVTAAVAAQLGWMLIGDQWRVSVRWVLNLYDPDMHWLRMANVGQWLPLVNAPLVVKMRALSILDDFVDALIADAGSTIEGLEKILDTLGR